MRAMSSNTPSNTPIARHLDSEYRRRWELYTTQDQVYDSRTVNWHDIPWDQVTLLQASVEGNEYTVDNTGPGFRRVCLLYRDCQRYYSCRVTQMLK